MTDLHDLLDSVASRPAMAESDLAAVRRRAGSIRRRRGLTTAGATALALAVVAGVGVALAPHGHDHAVPPASRSSAPVPLPDRSSPDWSMSWPASAGPASGGSAYLVTYATTAEDANGGESTVPYWSAGAITGTDGAQVTLPQRPVAFAEDPRGGWEAILGSADSGYQLVRLSATGLRIGPPEGTFARGLAVGPDGTLEVLEDGATGLDVHAVGAHGDAVHSVPGYPADAAALGLLGGSGAVFQTWPGKEVRIDSSVGLTTVHLPTGTTAGPIDSAKRLVSWQGDDGCSHVGSNEVAELWAACSGRIAGFSPDGGLALLAAPAGHPATLTLRDAISGTPRTTFTVPGGGFFGSWAWDGATLMTTVYDGHDWFLARLSTSGVTVLRGSSVPGTADQPAYVLGL
jgi:hypothetical protein